jgi:hypothetical protein
MTIAPFLPKRSRTAVAALMLVLPLSACEELKAAGYRNQCDSPVAAAFTSYCNPYLVRGDD